MPIWWEKELNDYLTAKHNEGEKMLRTLQEEWEVKQRCDTFDKIRRQQEAERTLHAYLHKQKAHNLALGFFSMAVVVLVALVWCLLR